ncbi:plancitoxin-1-like [Xyrichtys novacula]|uniref:Deoxyribonuclease-2-alpha n=1 Tax=Xyrichtys novacula TaxID=13765 RepID=A0AAV1FX65_XYRNO|nr:plancitoxin-1-like [Xyrichtys novacula]
MWRLVLALTLLCSRSEGAVSCKDDNGAAVNWYILYKTPNLQDQHLSGLEYVYMDDRGQREMGSSTTNFKGINHPEGVLANTLRPLFTPIRQMPSNFGFISYSDQPPGSSASPEFGHSKGVLMVDSTGSGVWLLHSTPQFPFRRDQNSFWPNSGASNAQTFICVTFLYPEFSKIGLHLQYIGAFPFEHDIPPGFHQELRDAVNWVKSNPSNNFQELTSTNLNLKFHSIAKQQLDESKREGPAVGDLYVTIGQLINSDVDVQSWGCQPDRKPSYCVKNQPKVYNVKNVWTRLGNWKPTRDHSKWCVSRDVNNHWTCLSDMNRSTSQYKRRGGALCFRNAAVKTFFRAFAHGTEDCSTPNIMDTLNTDCDASMDTSP